MIGILVGQVRQGCVLTASGVGYKVEVVEALAEASEIELLVVSHGRDADVKLYGFTTPATRDAFQALLKAPGVGPAAALAVLRALGVDALATALTIGDTAAIATAKGVGRKAAASIVSHVPANAIPTSGRPVAVLAPSDDDELVSALVGLGMTVDRARSALAASGLASTAPEAERLAAALAQVAGTIQDHTELQPNTDLQHKEVSP